MERCPVCQARLRGEAVCGRCQADLGRALAAEDWARAKLREAVAHLAADDLDAARRAVEASLAFKRDPLAARLREFLAWREATAPRWFPLP